jgi:hypothetical protein
VADPAQVRALSEVVRANPDHVFGATVDALVRLAGDGLDRLALMDLLWALQHETEALSEDALGLIGDVADALLGQCLPEHIIRLPGDAPGETALIEAAAEAARRWRPPSMPPR